MQIKSHYKLIGDTRVAVAAGVDTALVWPICKQINLHLHYHLHAARIAEQPTGEQGKESQ